MSQLVLAAGTVPHWHTKHPPLATSAGWSLSGVRLRLRPRRGQLAAAASNPPSATAELIGTKNQRHRHLKLRVDKYFELEMTVQDCELDKYGVVNNATYASHLHKAREEMLVSLGIGAAWIVSTGNAMAISEQNLNYFTPLRRGEKFVVMVTVNQIKGVRIFLEHVIETLPERRLVLEATATAVCLNTDYRPTRVFPEVSAELLHFFSSKDG